MKVHIHTFNYAHFNYHINKRYYVYQMLIENLRLVLQKWEHEAHVLISENDALENSIIWKWVVFLHKYIEYINIVCHYFYVIVICW